MFRANDRQEEVGLMDLFRREIILALLFTHYLKDPPNIGNKLSAKLKSQTDFLKKFVFFAFSSKKKSSSAKNESEKEIERNHL